MRELTIRLPNEAVEILQMTAEDINCRFNDRWTAETLAASFIRHILEDDAATHHPPPYLRLVK